MQGYGTFFAKKFGHIKKKQYLCTRFSEMEADCPLVYRYYTGFWFREARFDSSVDNKAAVSSLNRRSKNKTIKRRSPRVMEYTVLSNTKTKNNERICISRYSA